MKNKLLALLGVLGVVAFLLLSLYISTKLMAEPETKPPVVTPTKMPDEQLSDKLSDIGLEEEFIDTLTEREKQLEYYTTDELDFLESKVTLNRGMKEYRQGVGELLDLQADYLKRNYSSLFEDYRHELTNFNFTSDENSELLTLLLDAKVMSSYSEQTGQAQIEMLQMHTSPFGLMADVLFAGPYEKLAVTYDKSSLAPFTTMASLISQSIHHKGSDIHNKYIDMFGRLEAVFEYELAIEYIDANDDLLTTNIVCLVARDYTHQLTFIGAYSEGEHQIENLLYWSNLTGGYDYE